MWLAAVCSLIEQRPADLAVAEAPGDQAEDLHLARREPVRRGGVGGRDARAPGSGRAAPACRSARQSAAGLAEQRLGLFAVAAPACEQEAPVLVGGVGEPGRRPHAPVQLHGALEVLLGPVRLAERRGEHAQVAVGGAVAGETRWPIITLAPASGSSSG